MPKAKKSSKQESDEDGKPYGRASTVGRTVTKWTQEEKQAALNAVLEVASDSIDLHAVYAKMYPEGSHRSVKNLRDQITGVIFKSLKTKGSIS